MDTPLRAYAQPLMRGARHERPAKHGAVKTAVTGDPLEGDVVVLAVYYPDARGAVEHHGDRLAGKVVVDITNPVIDAGPQKRARELEALGLLHMGLQSTLNPATQAPSSSSSDDWRPAASGPRRHGRDIRVCMDEEVFNLSVRRFLKKLGVTAQREIELEVRERLAAGELEGAEKLPARATVTVQGVEKEIVVTGEIELA
jgi:hypothetical protein